MKIRTEKPEDWAEIDQVHFLAFGKQKEEGELVRRIRKSAGFIPGLSIVAENEAGIIGHILLSKAKLKNGQQEQEVIVLAPVAVKPDDQKKGIGDALIREGLRRCKDLGYGLVLLIGHPSYYPKFGFRPARQFGLQLRQFEVPDDVFMVCELAEGELQRAEGELQYPPAFLE